MTLGAAGSAQAGTRAAATTRAWSRCEALATYNRESACRGVLLAPNQDGWN